MNSFFLQIPQQPTFSDSLYTSMPYIIIGLIVGAIIVVAFLGIRWGKTKFDYDNPEGSPTYGFWHVWVKGQGVMEGWLSKNEVLEHFDEMDMVVKYAKENGIEINIDEIKKGINKEFFIFNLKRTDDYDLLEKKGKRTRLLVTGNPLNEKNHWYLPVKGRRSIKSIISPDRPRVMCLAYRTEKIDVETDDGTVNDWWIGAVEPDNDAQYYEFGYPKEAIKNKQYVYNLMFNSGFQKVAKPAELFAQFYKSVVERDNLEEKTKAQQQIIEKKEQEIKKINQKFQLANYALNQKKYVDKGKTIISGEPAFGAMLVIFAMIIGVIMYEMFPNMLPTLQNAQWVGFGIACVLVYFGIRAVVKSKQKNQMNIQTEDTELQ